MFLNQIFNSLTVKIRSNVMAEMKRSLNGVYIILIFNYSIDCM